MTRDSNFQLVRRTYLQEKEMPTLLGIYLRVAQDLDT
jgi:hypothetical protein